MTDQANSTAWDDNCLVDKNETQIRKVSSEHTFDRSPRKPLPHSDAYYMRLALQQADLAAQANEVPIGAIIVWDDGEIIGMGRNARESEKNALYHAECRAIDMACRSRGGWRLHRATLFVTLEPCPMCAGAIINARIPRVVFGAPDPHGGAMGSLCSLHTVKGLFHPEICSNVLREECTQLLRSFFSKLRQNTQAKD